jgi:uncharacterized protein (TIGR02246 family)
MRLWPRRPLLTATILLIAVLGSARGQAQAADPRAADTALIKQLFTEFNDATNAHDAQGAARLLSGDVDYIVTGNVVLQGRAKVQQTSARVFSTILKTMHRDVRLKEIRFLNARTAVVLSEYVSTRTDAPAKAQAASTRGLYDWVVTKQNGRWLISLWREGDAPAQR